MGLLDFAKSIGGKILGTAGTATAPPAQVTKEPDNRRLDVPIEETKSGVDTDVPASASSSASTEGAETIAPPGGEEPVVVAAAHNDSETAKTAPESKSYTVQPGDSLWKIAENEYGPGHGSKYHLIVEANESLLPDPDKIYPGQVLRIPPLTD